MSASKSPLGKGLSSLLGGDITTENALVKEVAIQRITANPNQPRKEFDAEALEELAASIRKHGVLQPILVRELTGSDLFEIIAGERRYRASTMAELTTMPVVIKSVDDTNAFVLALTENIQRKGLTAIEEAKAYEWLLTHLNCTIGALASMLGKSRGQVSNTLRLLQLPVTTQHALQENSLSPSHARAIITSKQPEVDTETIRKKQMSVRQVESMMRRRNQDSLMKTEAEVADLLRAVSRKQGIYVRLMPARSGEFHSSFRISGDEDKVLALMQYLAVTDIKK